MLGCASADSSDPGMSVETAAAVPGGTAHHIAVEDSAMRRSPRVAFFADSYEEANGIARLGS